VRRLAFGCLRTGVRLWYAGTVNMAVLVARGSTTLAAVIQFRLFEQRQDGTWAYWWAVATLWEKHRLTAWVSRKLEDDALERILIVARHLQAFHGIPVLSDNHLRALYWDRVYMTTKARGERGEWVTGRRAEWIGLRSLVMPSAVEQMLDEAERILEARDYLGLGVAWAYQPNRRELANVKQIERLADRFEAA
jgi:hypothetical protein